MAENKPQEKRQKICFIVSPIGPEGSDIRKRADKVLKHIIRPPLEECGYVVQRADNIADPGLITTQVIDKIRDSELVVADLTGHNPNVFYELAVRHAVAKPFIQIVELGETIPFDIAGFRTIHVDHTDLDSAADAAQEIKNQVGAIEKDDFKLVTPISFSVDMTAYANSDDQESIYISKLFDVVSSMQSQVHAIQYHLAAESRRRSKESSILAEDDAFQRELERLKYERDKALYEKDNRETEIQKAKSNYKSANRRARSVLTNRRDNEK